MSNLDMINDHLDRLNNIINILYKYSNITYYDRNRTINNIKKQMDNICDILLIPRRVIQTEKFSFKNVLKNNIKYIRNDV